VVYLGPRALSGVVVRPLNFTVRRPSAPCDDCRQLSV